MTDRPTLPAIAVDRCPPTPRRALPGLPAPRGPGAGLRRRTAGRLRRRRGHLRLRAGPSGPVLETLARSIGSVPRVLLPDTATDDAGVAVIKPSSAEMPAPGRARRPLPALRRDRPRRHGRRPQGPRPRPRPRPGRQGPARATTATTPDLVRRFVEEAQIGGQLQHPGIVPVYELGTFADRRPFFTMKLVKGRTLAALLAERPIAGRRPAPVPVASSRPVCQTVAYAHARGVIHRDLKPSNVMVGRFGEVQVMDWGLAKVLPRGGRRRRCDGRARAARGDADRDGAERLGRRTLSQAGSVHGHAGVHGPRAGRAARSTGSTSGPTSSRWARSSARSSPASRPSPGRARPRSSARRRGATRPTPWPGSTAAGPTPS